MLANTNNQTIAKHSFAIGILAAETFKKLISKNSYDEIINELDIDKIYNYDKILNTLFNTGVFHDIGKLDANFQNYLKTKLDNNNKIDADISYEVQIETDDKMDDKYSSTNYPRHQELSWAMLNLATYEEDKKSHKLLLQYVVYWHHAKTFRTYTSASDFTHVNKILNNSNLKLSDLITSSNNFLTEIKNLMLQYSYGYNELMVKYFDNTDSDSPTEIPKFQVTQIFKTDETTRHSLFKNSLNHLLRSILITADRKISKLTENELTTHLQNQTLSSLIEDVNSTNSKELLDGIELMIHSFNNKEGSDINRNKLQDQTALKLAQIDDIAILSGPAGVGKTKIMLQWLKEKKNVDKVYIIMPRTSICFSLYNELKDDYLKFEEGKRNVKMQLITGDDKKEYYDNCELTIDDEKKYFDANIIVTTIDQVLMRMLSHNSIDVFLDVMKSTLIFDEFHEFLEQSAILMLFAQMMYIKRMFDVTNCLLVSATPNQFLTKEILYLKDPKHLVKIDSFNTKPYTINLVEFDDGNASELNYDMYKHQKEGSILIFNTAQKSQYSMILANKDGEQKSLIYHSKLLSSDKQTNFQLLKDEFGKKSQQRKTVLRVGPILQASIDVSTINMKTEISNIDNIFQRMGRLNRWGFEDISEYTIYIPKGISEESSKNASVKLGLSNNNNFYSTLAWINFIKKHIKSGKQYTLKDLYALYDDFFDSFPEKKNTMEAYNKDFEKIKISAQEIFSQSFEPIQYPVFIKSDTDEKPKLLSKKSLRGQSVYTVVCNLNYDVNNNQIISEPSKLSDNLLSMNKNIYTRHEKEHLEKLLEDNKAQIQNAHQSSIICKQIYDKLITLPKFKNAKNLKKLNHDILMNLARNGTTPIMLSFSKYNPPDDDAQGNNFYNITYKGLVLGIMKFKQFKNII